MIHNFTYPKSTEARRSGGSVAIIIAKEFKDFPV